MIIAERISLVDWVIIPILIMVVLMAFVRARENGVFKLLFSSFFSLSLVKGVSVGKQTGGLTNTILSVNGFLGVGILAYLYGVKHLNLSNTLFLLTVLTGAGFIWYFMKWLGVSFISFVSEERQVFEEVLANGNHYFQMLGVLFVPGLFVALLVPSEGISVFGIFKVTENIGFLYCVFVSSALYCFRLFRGYLQSVGYKISWYYIILYLCTLEILPLVVLIKTLVGDFTMFN